MNKREIMSYNKFPMKINLMKIGDIYNNFNKELRIIYVLEGIIKLEINQKNYSLDSNNFILVNGYEFYGVLNESLEKSIYLEIRIDDIYYAKYIENFAYIRYNCNSLNKNIEERKYNEIRSIISKIINNLFLLKEENNIIILNLINELVYKLMLNFKEENYSTKKIDIDKNRLRKIFNYLEQNYDDYNLKAQNLAEYMNLNTQYLLRIFKQNIGVGLYDLLNSIRLRKSLNQLLYTKNSIIEIAIENGFNDNRSYNRLFKEKYGLTPGDYRKKFEISENKKKLKSEEIFGLKTIEKIILKKIMNYEESNIVLEEEKYQTKYKEIDMNSLKELNVNSKYCNQIMCIGSDYKGLLGDIQQQIIKSRDELNLEYIKILEINKKSIFIENEKKINYLYLDKLVDFIIKSRLKLFLNFGFLIDCFNSADEYSSLLLIKDLVSHFLKRYSLEELNLWYFEISIDEKINNYSFREKKDFYIILNDILKYLKTQFSKSKVGILANTSQMDDMMKIFNSNDVSIDFISIYSENIKSIKDIRLKFNMLSTKKLKIFLNEKEEETYNNVTGSKSISIIENYIKNINEIDYFIYNLFDSSIDLFKGTGLITFNGIKKMEYNALLLINKLGNIFLEKNENYIFFKDNEKYNIIIYNNYNFEGNNIKYNLKIKDLSKGKYLITKYYLNDKIGSTYTAWEKVSNLELSSEIYEYLKSKEKMLVNLSETNIESNFYISETLYRNDIIFYELKKLKY